MILTTCIIYATITNNKIKAIMMFFIKSYEKENTKENEQENENRQNR